MSNEQMDTYYLQILESLVNPVKDQDTAEKEKMITSFLSKPQNFAFFLLKQITKRENPKSLIQTCLVLFSKCDFKKLTNDEQKRIIDIIYHSLENTSLDNLDNYMILIESLIQAKQGHLHMDQKFYEKQQNYLMSLLKSKLNNKNELIVELYIFQKLFTTQPRHLLGDFYHQHQKTFQFLYNNLIQKHIINFQQRNQFQQDVETTKNILVLQRFLSILQYVSDKASKQELMSNVFNLSEFKELYSSQNIIEIAHISFQKILRNEQQFTFLVDTGDIRFNEKLQKIKYSCLRIIKNLIQFNIEENIFNEMELRNFQIFIKTQICQIQEFLKIKDAMDYLEENILIKKTVQIIIQTLLISVGSSQYYSVFQKLKNDIIVNIILLVFQTSKKEREDFDINPIQQVNDVQRILYENSQDLIIQCFGDFLLEMCAKLDGVLTTIFNILLEVQQQAFNSNKDYPYLQPINDSHFMKNTTQNERIELSFLLLCIIRSQIEQRQDLLQKLDEFFKEFQHHFESLQGFQKSRYLFFLCEYVENLFHTNEYTISGKEVNPRKINSILWFIDQTQDNTNAKITAIENIDFLNLVDTDTDSFMKQIAKPYLELMIRLIDERPLECKGYYQCIQIFLDKKQNKYQIFIDNPQILKNLLQIIINTVRRLINKDDPKKESCINKSFHLIEKLTEIPTICKRFDDVFYDCYIQLLQIIQKPNHQFYQWDEDIIQGFVVVIKASGSKPNCSNYLFEQFPALVASNGNRISIIKKILNIYLYQFQEYFDQEKINFLMQMLFDNMRLDNFKDSYSCRIYLSDTIELIQCLIQNMSHKMSNEQIGRLFSKFEELLTMLQDPNCEQISNSMFKFIQGIWLSLVIFLEENFLSLIDQNILINNTRCIIENSTLFTQIYYKKLLSLGMVKILAFYLKFALNSTDIIALLLNFVIPFLMLQYNTQINSILSNQERQLSEHEMKYIHLQGYLEEMVGSCNRKQSFDEMDYDELNHQEEEEKEEWISLIYYQDEYEILEKILKQVALNHSQFYTNITPHLTETTKKFFFIVTTQIRYQIFSTSNPQMNQIRRFPRYLRTVNQLIIFYKKKYNHLQMMRKVFTGFNLSKEKLYFLHI